jgi:hypothetical protein
MDEEAGEQSGVAALDDESSNEPGTWPLRPVIAIAALLLAGVLIYAGYSCVRAAGGGGTFTAPEKQFPTGTVTYVAPGRFYLVRDNGGSFLALSEVEDSAADRIGGCVIRYRADLNTGDQKGVFRDDCHGTLFNPEGIAIDGSAPPMQQHPVRVNNGTVAVPLRACIAGGGGTTPEPCRE